MRDWLVCEVCWFRAWEPIEEESACALIHPHDGEHIRCAYCWLKDQHMKSLECCGGNCKP